MSRRSVRRLVQSHEKVHFDRMIENVANEKLTPFKCTEQSSKCDILEYLASFALYLFIAFTGDPKGVGVAKPIRR